MTENQKERMGLKTVFGSRTREEASYIWAFLQTFRHKANTSLSNKSQNLDTYKPPDSVGNAAQIPIFSRGSRLSVR